MGNIPENIGNAPPKDFYVLKEPGFADPSDKNRNNRLCVCFSDLHFTDGTAGNQSADDTVWDEVFNNIADLCVDHEIQELTLVLVGDVADMIRTAQWAQNGVYPWQREDPRFKGIVYNIMNELIRRHARPPSPENMCGVFLSTQGVS